MSIAAATALTILGSFLASVAGTWMVRTWLENKRVLDAPTERSLHQDTTVTGGGTAIAFVMVVLWSILALSGLAPAVSILLPLVGLSLIGLMDDVYDVTWVRKLAFQFCVAVFFVFLHGPFSRLEFFGLVIQSQWLSVVFSVLWIVALVNIYNFMDGIDGLAGGYGALCACILGIWFFLLGGEGMALFLYGLMAACLGFLVWNWAPARIFMGDAGSMMLGGVLAAVALAGQREYDVPLSAFILLYAVFIADTTFTLVRRARRGAPLWRAHKEHFYQRAVESGLTHPVVTGIVLVLSAIICVPASLEMSRANPRFLWLILGLLLLCIAMVLVNKREREKVTL